MSDEMRPWVDDNGHVLGMAGRNGSGITQLWIYRHAIDLTADEPAAPEVMGIAQGHVFDIRCDVCGAVRTWVPGDEAMRRLLEAAGRKVEGWEHL